MGFNSRKVAIRAQKKVFGKISSRAVAKHFISETASNLLDKMYRLLKEHYGRKEAEKVVKCAIKMVVKMAVLLRGEMFSTEEQHTLDVFVRKFRQLVLTVISFNQVEFSYDRQFLLNQMDENRKILLKLIRPHLSDKSGQRVERIFAAFSNDQFMDCVFRPRSKYSEIRQQISSDLNKLLDQGEL